MNLISIKLTQQAVKVRPIFLSRACDVAEPFAKKKNNNNNKTPQDTERSIERNCAVTVNYYESVISAEEITIETCNVQETVTKGRSSETLGFF